MEATKLNNVLLDVLNEHKDYMVFDKIANMISYIQSNQSAEIKKTLYEIEMVCNSSVINTYSISNSKILIEIGGENFFGIQAYETIKNILNSNSYNITQIVAELQEYQKLRTEFIKNITNITDSFKKLNIQPHFNSDYIYELGILLPQDGNHDSIKTLTKELNNWDKSIKTFRELVGLDIEDTKLTLVNNGSLEFFTNSPAEVALCLSFTLERLFALYKKILDIKLAREKLIELGVPKTESDVALKHEKDIYKKETEKIANDLIKQFASKNIESGRLNELKISIKGHINYYAKCIDNGLVLEIIPPEILEPTFSSEPDNEANKKEREIAKIDFNKKVANIELIQKRVELAKEIMSNGKEIFKLIASISEKEDDDDE